MMILFLRQLKNAFLLLLLLSFLTGFIYPGVITLLAQCLFPWQANGSLILRDNHVVGSLLLGQAFTDGRYFFGRPSATTPCPYNALNSSGSNFSMGNPSFLALITERVAAFHRLMPENTAPIPVDLVTASGSGLDPEISPAAAYYQATRIAKLRHLSSKEVEDIITTYIKPRTFNILGEPRVNVLQLNLVLDALSAAKELNDAPQKG